MTRRPPAAHKKSPAKAGPINLRKFCAGGGNTKPNNPELNFQPVMPWQQYLGVTYIVGILMPNLRNLAYFKSLFLLINFSFIVLGSLASGEQVPLEPTPRPYQWFSAWMLRAEKAIARNKIHSGIFAVCFPTWQTGLELRGIR